MVDLRFCTNDELIAELTQRDMDIVIGMAVVNEDTPTGLLSITLHGNGAENVQLCLARDLLKNIVDRMREHGCAEGEIITLLDGRESGLTEYGETRDVIPNDDALIDPELPDDTDVDRGRDTNDD